MGTALLTTLVLALIRLALRSSTEGIGQDLLMAIAATLLLFHVTNTLVRRHLDHWKNADLVRPLFAELVLGVGMPFAVVCLSIVCPSEWWSFLATALSFGISFCVYEAVEESIHRIVKREKLVTCTAFYGKFKPFKLFGIHETIHDIARRPHQPGAQRFLAWWVEPSPTSALEPRAHRGACGHGPGVLVGDRRDD